MVAVVPDGVDVCIYRVLREAYYYGVVISNETCALSLLLRENPARHSSNVQFQVPIGQRGVLYTVTSPGQCLRVSVSIQSACIRFFSPRSATTRILLGKLSRTGLLLQVPIPIVLRIS